MAEKKKKDDTLFKEGPSPADTPVHLKAFGEKLKIFLDTPAMREIFGCSAAEIQGDGSLILAQALLRWMSPAAIMVRAHGAKTHFAVRISDPKFYFRYCDNDGFRGPGHLFKKASGSNLEKIEAADAGKYPCPEEKVTVVVDALQNEFGFAASVLE